MERKAITSSRALVAAHPARSPLTSLQAFRAAQENSAEPIAESIDQVCFLLGQSFCDINIYQKRTNPIIK